MRRRWPLFLLLLLAALLVWLPLSLALGAVGLDRLGLTARGVHGSVWRGQLEGAEMGGVPLGNVDVRLAPLALLTGTARFELKGEGANGIAASAYATPSGFGAERVSLTVPVGERLGPFAPTSATFSDAAFFFSGGRCRQASGQVRLALAALPAGLDISRNLSGPLRCDGEALATSLTGASGLERVALRVFPEGRYDGIVTIRNEGAAANIALGFAGFQQTQSGYVARFSGSF